MILKHVHQKTTDSPHAKKETEHKLDQAASEKAGRSKDGRITRRY